MSKLKDLFDYQKFEWNSHLSDLIADTEERNMNIRKLDEGEMDLVTAGGILTRPCEYREDNRVKEPDDIGT